MNGNHCRRLTWLHQHSEGDLQIIYTKQKYILHVSTYQMVVLLLFNKLQSWTVQQMQDETKIKADLLLQILCDLLKAKLLICSEINKDKRGGLKSTGIKMDSVIELNDSFKR
jgi:hypothetical protein